MKRDQRLDVARCFMNYMIVLLHAWAAFQYVPNRGLEFVSWTFICSHLCWMAIPAFFLISGYLLFSNYDLSKWPAKMRNRMKRLAIPYIVWNLTFVVAYLLMGKVVPRIGTRVETFGIDTVSGAFSKVLSLTVSPIDGPLWFIRSVFLFALVSPLIYLLLKPLKGKFALVVCLIWCILEPCLGLGDAMHMIAPAYAMLCFVVGGALAINGKDIVLGFKNKVWLLLGGIACVIRAVLFLRFQQDSVIPISVAIQALSVLEAPALVCLFANIDISPLTKNKAYLFLKEMSFFAYAGHFLFCSSVLHILAPKLAFMTVGKFSVLICIFFFGGILALTLAFGVLRRACPKLLRLYDGSL